MSERGFTLVELLIVFVVFGILFAIVGTLSSNTLPKNQLKVEADVVESMLRQAQSRTIAQDVDSVWGVHLTSADATLFAGTSYGARDTTYDIVRTFPDIITASGLTDVIFDYRTGKTSNTGTITLTASITGETESITVNANGEVDK